MDRSGYYERAASWALDRQADDGRARRLLAILAGVLGGIALFEAVALAMLAPLKTTQTITLLVDKQTGYVQALDPLQPRRLSADDALTNAYLAQYVTAREGFDRATVAADYRRVGAWSGGQARASYLALMPASNASSPLQRYPGGTIVETRIASVSRLNLGVALVRFVTTPVDRSGQRGATQPWVAVVRFRYVDAPMRFEDRLLNPLGFQVMAYRRDPEAPPPPPAPVATPAMVVPPVARQPIVLRREPAALPLAPAVRPRRIATLGPSAARTELREVPINQIPLGSPLSPDGRPLRLAGQGRGL